MQLLFWEISSLEILRTFLLILTMAVLYGAVCSLEMDMKQKRIVAAICIAVILFIPASRRIEISHYIEKEGYTAILAERDLYSVFLLNNSYREASNLNFLNQPFLVGFRFEHNHKLIYPYWTRSGVAPEMLGEIEFLD